MAEIIFKDRVKEGLGYLITQWKDKPNVVGLLTSFLENIQLIEDSYEQLNKERSLDTAVGYQLDVLGLLIGQERDGRTDADYRTALRLRIAINKSNGTEPSIVEALTIATGNSNVEVFDRYPAGVHVEVTDVTLELLNTLAEVLEQIVAATISPTIAAEFSLVFDTGDTLGVSQNNNDNLSAYIIGGTTSG